MNYNFGDLTIYFSLYQGNFYVAQWDGDSVVSDKRQQFIDLINEKTGIDKIALHRVATECYGPAKAQPID